MLVVRRLAADAGFGRASVRPAAYRAEWFRLAGELQSLFLPGQQSPPNGSHCYFVDCRRPLRPLTVTVRLILLVRSASLRTHFRIDLGGQARMRGKPSIVQVVG